MLDGQIMHQKPLISTSLMELVNDSVRNAPRRILRNKKERKKKHRMNKDKAKQTQKQTPAD